MIFENGIGLRNSKLLKDSQLVSVVCKISVTSAEIPYMSEIHTNIYIYIYIDICMYVYIYIYICILTQDYLFII